MSESTLKKSKWTRWFRFNLRTFLVVVALFSAFIGWYLYRVQQQRRAVQWIENAQGEVWYNYQLQSVDSVANQSAVSAWPGWLVELLGIDFFERVVMARIYYAPEVSGISQLKGLPNLKSLTLSCISASDLSVIKQLTELEELHLRGESFSDLSPLSNASSLQSLVLVNTKVTDIRPVCNLESLNFLEIYNAPISTIVAFQSAQRRFNVKLNLTEICEEDLEFLKEAWPGRISTGGY